MSDKKVYIDSLSIEVTRRCNLECEHCMRGDAQNKDLDIDLLEKFFQKINGISGITLTGGEPTLALDKIKAVRELLIKYEIPLSWFYIVINGTYVSDEFLVEMIQWYTYCTKHEPCEELCGVAISRDDFHDEIYEDDLIKLKGLSFFRPHDKEVDFSTIPLLNIGRAKNLNGYKKRNALPTKGYEVKTFGDGSINIYDTTLGFTVDGNILNDCDYAYDDIEDILITNVNEPLWFEKLICNPNYIAYRKPA